MKQNTILLSIIINSVLISFPAFAGRGCGFGGGFAAGAFTGLGAMAIGNAIAQNNRPQVIYTQPTIVQTAPDYCQDRYCQYEEQTDSAYERAQQAQIELLREQNRQKELELQQEELNLRRQELAVRSTKK